MIASKNYLDFLAFLDLFAVVLVELFFNAAAFRVDVLMLVVLLVVFFLLQLQEESCSIAAFQSWRELLAGQPAFFQM